MRRRPSRRPGRRRWKGREQRRREDKSKRRWAHRGGCARRACRACRRGWWARRAPNARRL